MENMTACLRCLELLQMYAAGALVYLGGFADLAAPIGRMRHRSTGARRVC